MRVRLEYEGGGNSDSQGADGVTVISKSANSVLVPISCCSVICGSASASRSVEFEEQIVPTLVLNDSNAPRGRLHDGNSQLRHLSGTFAHASRIQRQHLHIPPQKH